MATLVAFASLPFGLRSGTYMVRTPAENVAVHVTAPHFSPFLTVVSRPELAQSIPSDGQGEGFTSYTWYDHPFVLRATFGRNVAALGSINSCATIFRPLPDDLDVRDASAIGPVRERFAELALNAFNNLVGAARLKARLYHVFDLRRDDIELTIRREDGTLLQDDPLHATLAQEEVAQAGRFDLAGRSDQWYAELEATLQRPEPVSLSDDLLIEAERALAQRFPRQAIATCHIAVEIAASALLTRGMRKRGVPNKEIDEVLSTRSLTSKLDVLLRAYTGFSLKRHNPSLWKSFNLLNDLRNDAVHHGRHATTEDAQLALNITRELVAWLDMVSARNK